MNIPTLYPEAWPRGMKRRLAAKYLNIGVSTFDRWVQDGTLPQPKRKGGNVLWDRVEIDEAFDALSDADNDNPADGLDKKLGTGKHASANG